MPRRPLPDRNVPSVDNGICRGPAQWQAVMQTDRRVPFEQHSHQAIIPSADELCECVSQTTQALQNLTVCTYATGELLSTRGVIQEEEL